MNRSPLLCPKPRKELWRWSPVCCTDIWRGVRYWMWTPAGLLQSLTGKESTCNVGDTGDVGLIPGLARSPGGAYGNPLQYSCLGNPVDRGAWRATVHGVAKNSTQLSYCVGMHVDPNPHDSQDNSFLSELLSPSTGPQACMHVRHWVWEEFVIYFWIAACEKLKYMWMEFNRMLKCLFSC